MNESGRDLRPGHRADAVHSRSKRFEADRKIAAAEGERRREAAPAGERDIENVRGVIEAAGDFQKLMDEVIAANCSSANIASAAEDGRMKNVTAILSMLHERPGRTAPPGCFAASRCCAGRLHRLGPARASSTSIAMLCWEDQLKRCAARRRTGGVRAGQGRAAHHRAGVEAVTAARRWSDGWRGGLLATCDFDLGFYAPWYHAKLRDKLGSDAVVLIDPAAALVDPESDRCIWSRMPNRIADAGTAASRPPPGPVRRAASPRRCSTAWPRPRRIAGRLLHYHPDQTRAASRSAPNLRSRSPHPLARTRTDSRSIPTGRSRGSPRRPTRSTGSSSPAAPRNWSRASHRRHAPTRCRAKSCWN